MIHVDFPTAQISDICMDSDEGVELGTGPVYRILNGHHTELESLRPEFVLNMDVVTLCALCHGDKDAHAGFLGQILGPIQSCYVHRLCALWAPEVRRRLEPPRGIPMHCYISIVNTFYRTCMHE